MSQGVDIEKPEARTGELLAQRYRLDRLLAKGGMGRVYVATQLPLEREVAVKVLVSRPNDAEFRQRFFLEASTCAKLVHRHIVTVHDYGEADDGELFMAMELLDGEPLSKVIAKQIRIDSVRTCQIALQVCRALRTAHKTGVVHRDLKPGNIMLIRDDENDGSDFVKVLDFGLVKVFEREDGEAADLTRSGAWLGSPRFMAPEQIRCKAVDPRTDVYSLGVIMYNMIAGRPPFVGANSVEILEQHLRDPMPGIRETVGDIDFAPELEVIISRCMEKQPADRYPSMDDLIADLEAAHRLITGVGVHSDSQFVLSDVSDVRAVPPDLSLPPARALAAPPPPAAFPSRPPPPSESHDSVSMALPSPGGGRLRLAVLVGALLFASIAGFAAVRALTAPPPDAAKAPSRPAKPTTTLERAVEPTRPSSPVVATPTSPSRVDVDADADAEVVERPTRARKPSRRPERRKAAPPAPAKPRVEAGARAVDDRAKSIVVDDTRADVVGDDGVPIVD